MAEKTAGEKLVDKILTDLKTEGIVPDSREAELLDHARDMADRIEELKTLSLSMGRPSSTSSATSGPRRNSARFGRAPSC
jgi:hypothetical protein